MANPPQNPPVHDLLDGKSQAEVARHLASVVVSDGAPPSEGSIAKALGRLLGDGANAWWLKPDRVPYRRELLVVCPGMRDLLPVEVDVGEYPLGDFPSVGDVSLMDALPLISGSFQGIEDAAGFGAVWLEAPAGAGKSLCCRRLRASRPDLDVHVVATLADGAGLPRGALPLVLDVQRESEPREDAAAAGALLRKGSVCVLARFEPPGDPRDRLVPNKEHWSIRFWEPLPEWRTTYIAWALQRAGQRELVPVALRLLQRLDPTGDWFDTPGVVQGLLAAVVRGGATQEAPEQTVLRAGSVVLRQRAQRSADAWCRTHGEAAVRRIAEQRAATPGVPWDHAIGMDPNGGATDLPDGGLRQLAEAGLLREVGLDAYRCEPYWVWQGLGADAVVKLVATGDIGRWGRAGTGPDRARHLEHALTALDDRAFWRLVGSVVDAWKREGTLSHAAAVEACFSCAAKRGKVRGRGRTATRLWKAQRDLWVDFGGRVGPGTRPGLGDGFEDSCAWVADCWSWSFHFSKPDDVSTGELEPWLWPGWCSPSLDKMPEWFAWLGGPSLYSRLGEDSVDAQLAERWEWPDGFLLMVGLVPELMRRATRRLPPRTNCVLTPYLAVERCELEALREVAAGESWMVLEVHHLMRHKSDDEQQAVADRMLASLCREGALVAALERMRRLFPGLWHQLGVLANPREALGEARSALPLINTLPPRLMTPVLLELVEHHDFAMVLANAALSEEAGSVDAVVWHRVLRHGTDVGHPVARVAWHTDEEATEAFMVDVWNEPIGRLLWSEAPARAKVRLLEGQGTDALRAAANDEGFRRQLHRLVRTEPLVAEAAWRLLHEGDLNG